MIKLKMESKKEGDSSALIIALRGEDNVINLQSVTLFQQAGYPISYF